jgi:hypothetical protein
MKNTPFLLLIMHILVFLSYTTIKQILAFEAQY